MSKRQISKLYPGTLYLNSKQMRWFEKLLEKSNKCEKCGSRENLEPHHIIPVNIYDDNYFDIDNGAVLCHKCHNDYHKNYFPIDKITFKIFVQNKKLSNFSAKKKKNKYYYEKPNGNYQRKKYEHSPLYSKIKINDFRKKIEKPKKKTKSRKRRKNKRLKKFNPIYLCKYFGSDDYEYIQRMEIEKEVLGDILDI